MYVGGSSVTLSQLVRGLERIVITLLFIDLFSQFRSLCKLNAYVRHQSSGNAHS